MDKFNKMGAHGPVQNTCLTGVADGGSVRLSFSVGRFSCFLLEPLQWGVDSEGRGCEMFPVKGGCGRVHWCGRPLWTSNPHRGDSHVPSSVQHGTDVFGEGEIASLFDCNLALGRFCCLYLHAYLHTISLE